MEASFSHSTHSESSILPANSSTITTPLEDFIPVEPSCGTDSHPSLPLALSSPALNDSEPLLQPQSSNLSAETVQPKGQITKVKYRRALFLTPDDLNEMMEYGARVCEQHDILGGKSTLRELQKKNPNAIEKTKEQVALRSEATDCVNSSRSPRNLNASKMCPGQLMPCYNLFSGIRDGERRRVVTGNEATNRWIYQHGMIVIAT